MVGAFFLVEALYVTARYLVNLPANISTGLTKMPWWMAFNIHAQEIILPAIVVVFLIKFVALPLWRHQPVAWDGWMLIALATLTWQNYMIDFLRYWSTYNSIVINRGSWYNYTFLWSAAPNPATHFVEAPFYDLTIYPVFGLALIWFCFLLRRIKRRWPHMGTARLFAILLGFCMLLDVAVEDLWMRGGLYTYAGSPNNWTTLFRGHYYQFPLIEPLALGLLLTAMAAVRYFRNDKGESIFERKVDDMLVGRKRKNWYPISGTRRRLQYAVFGVRSLYRRLCVSCWRQLAGRYSEPFVFHGRDLRSEIDCAGSRLPGARHPCHCTRWRLRQPAGRTCLSR